ncbi:MAG: pyruvate kinase, partial [Patescibacteria group bacterium]
MENRTKIICTIGPSSESKPVLRKMMRAGMDLVRLNFSHGNYSQFVKIIRNVRSVAAEMKREIGIIQDLQGPKIRVGDLPESGIKVKHGQKVTLSTKIEKGTVPIQYKALPHDVRHGDIILIDDGLIELKVDGVNAAKTRIECTAQTNGI